MKLVNFKNGVIMKSSTSYLAIDNDFAWRLFLTLCAVMVVIGASDSAFAGNSADVVGQTLCRLTANLTGGIAKATATIAIFAVGIGLFMGKLNWGIAAATAGGVGIIFGAPKLVLFLSGGTDSTCPTS